METEVVLSIVLDIIALLGLIGNIISVLILNSRDMKTSKNFILKGLSNIKNDIPQIPYPRTFNPRVKFFFSNFKLGLISKAG